MKLLKKWLKVTRLAGLLPHEWTETMKEAARRKTKQLSYAIKCDRRHKKKEKEKRRAANKVARRSRRINRDK